MSSPCLTDRNNPKLHAVSTFLSVERKHDFVALEVRKPGFQSTSSIYMLYCDKSSHQTGLSVSSSASWEGEKVSSLWVAGRIK